MSEDKQKSKEKSSTKATPPESTEGSPQVSPIRVDPITPDPLARRILLEKWKPERKVAKDTEEP